MDHSIDMDHSIEMSPSEAPNAVDGGTTVACVILGLSFLVGVPGNLLVIWTILRHVKQRFHTVVLILHLAVADTMVLITLPFWIYSLVHNFQSGLVVCNILIRVITVCMYSSIFFITLMSVERYLAICHPFLMMRWNMNGCIAFSWLLALLLGLSEVLAQTLAVSEQNDQCFDRDINNHTLEIVFFCLKTLLGFALPFITLSICYCLVAAQLKKMRFNSKLKSKVLIHTVVLVFLLCWLPYRVINIIDVICIFGTDKEDGCVLESLVFSSGALAFISSSVNPVLYAFLPGTSEAVLESLVWSNCFRNWPQTQIDSRNSQYSSRRTRAQQTRSSHPQLSNKNVFGVALQLWETGLRRSECFLLY